MKVISWKIFIGILFSFRLWASEGVFINPLTDICWECLFPITISGQQVSSGKDFEKHTQAVCYCSNTPPTIGIPITFWEPSKVIDVTMHAYKLIGMGGVSVGQETIKNRGTLGTQRGSSTNTSFYHVHLYDYPVLYMLQVLSDFSTCIESGDFEIPYMSELDPMWGDDSLALINNPEAGLFSSKEAHLACVADCAASSFSKPLDALFWCAGCEGSLYPFSGTVAHHVGGVQASSLILQRCLAKLHRMNLLKGYKKGDYCQQSYMPIINKSAYKTQLVHPVKQTKGECHALGKSDLIWGAGKSYPYGGEDFAYLLWTKKQCCLDALKTTTTVIGVTQ